MNEHALTESFHKQETDMNANAIAEADIPSLPAAGEATQLTPMQMAYQLIARGADFAAVREMIEFGKKLEADEAEKAFNVAMAAAQAEMQKVAVNATNTQTRSKYATYDQLDKALRPIYTKHGFALSFDEADSPKPEHVRIVCHVTHTAGHCRMYHRDMPADGKGAKGGDVMTKTHAVGAAAAYGMRYILRGVFNVAVGEEDRDGNMPGDTVTSEQLEELRALADEVGGDIAKLCAHFKVEALPDLPRAKFVEAIGIMELKRRKASK